MVGYSPLTFGSVSDYVPEGPVSIEILLPGPGTLVAQTFVCPTVCPFVVLGPFSPEGANVSVSSVGPPFSQEAPVVCWICPLLSVLSQIVSPALLVPSVAALPPPAVNGQGRPGFRKEGLPLPLRPRGSAVVPPAALIALLIIPC